MLRPLPSRCAPCEKGSAPLTLDEARERAQLVPLWTLDYPRISRHFVARDFRRALAWVNRVGMLAEEEGHHPDFHLTSWKEIELVLWTHAIGGLSENDFVLARKIDELAHRDGLDTAP